MSVSLQAYIARATEEKAKDLLAAARAVPAEKQTWKPGGSGRSVVDQVAECALTNEMTVTLLRSRVWDTAGQAERRRIHASLDTLDKAAAKLVESTTALARAFRALPDEDLELEIVLPDETVTVRDDMLHSYWNMAYHEGQINLIRTLPTTPE